MPHFQERLDGDRAIIELERTELGQGKFRFRLPQQIERMERSLWWQLYYFLKRVFGAL